MSRLVRDLEDFLRREADGEERALATMRAKIRCTSSLLAPLCELHGLPPEALAYAMMLNPIVPLAGESLEKWGRERHHSRYASITGEMLRRLPTDAACLPLDPTVPSVLRLDARSHRMEVRLETGAGVIRSHRGTATLDLPFTLPEAVVEAAIGRPVRAIHDHPIILSDGFIVDQAFWDPIFEITSIRFRCPEAPFGIGDRPSTRLGLHADPKLRGAEAVDDVVRRIVAASEEAADALAVFYEARSRIRRINLGQTSLEDLRDPNLDRVVAIVTDQRSWNASG